MIKNILIALAVMVSGFVQAQDDHHSEGGINWVTLNEAQELMKDEPRKIIVDVYTPWCGPCKMMMTRTFTDKDLIEYINENFYAVKFNGEGNESVTLNGKEYTNPKFDPERNPNMRNATHQLTYHFQVRGYPTLMILDEDTQVETSIVGFRPAEQLMKDLKAIE